MSKLSKTAFHLLFFAVLYSSLRLLHLPLLAQVGNEQTYALYLPWLATTGLIDETDPVTVDDEGPTDQQDDLAIAGLVMVQSVNTPPLIDGKVDRLWNSTPDQPLQQLILGSPVAGSDLAGSFKARYDANNLYLLISVNDDRKRNDSATQWWEDDSIEVYLDGNKSGGSSYDGVNDYQLVFRWNDPTIIRGPNSQTAPAGLQWRRVNTSIGYRLEVAIPLRSVGIAPVVGYGFGLDVHLIDDDDGGARENKLAWNATADEAWRNPGYFGVAQLIGATAPTATPTPTASPTATATPTSTATQTPTATPTTPPVSDARSLFPRLEVELVDEAQGVEVFDSGLGYLDHGDWVRYNRVDFGAGATLFQANLAVPADFAGKQIEIRIDRLDGPLLGALTTQATGGWERYTVQRINITPVSGVHDLYLIFRGGDGVANLDWVHFAPITAPAAPPQAIPATFFGMHIHRAATGLNGQPFWPDAPFHLWRLHDVDHLHWFSLEPAQDQWNFTLFDNAITQAERHGARLLYTLGQTPTWASARPTEDGAYGAKGAAAEPANLADWRDYVRTVATRYKGRIHYYEIWNEADLREFYSGDVATMVQMARDAYTILKAIDPTITVLAPSMTADFTHFTWLTQFLAQGGGNYYDINNVHFYIPATAKPEEIYGRAMRTQQFLRNNGQGHKPLWNSETGFGRTLENVLITGDDAVGFVARAHLVQWLAGVAHFDWYAWDNRHWVGLYFVEADLRTPTAAAHAYSETQKWLIGARLTTCQIAMDATWLCHLIGADGNPAQIVWNPEQTVAYRLPDDARRLRRLTGQTTTVTGGSTITIGTLPVYLERRRSAAHATGSNP